MKKLKTCVFSAIVLLIISFRDEAESKPLEFPQEREISLKKEMEIVRRLKRYMEENDDFIEKFHSGKMSKRSNLDPNSRFQRSDRLDGPPSAKEAKKSETHTHVIKKDHPPDGKHKIPSRMEQTTTQKPHKKLTKTKNVDSKDPDPEDMDWTPSKRSNMAEESRLGTSLNQAEASQDQAI